MSVRLKSNVFLPLICFLATFIGFLSSEADARINGLVNLLDVSGINRMLHDKVLKKDLGSSVRRQLQLPSSDETEENWTGRWFPESSTTTLPFTDGSQLRIEETKVTSDSGSFPNSSSLPTNDLVESWTGRWFPEKPSTTPLPSIDGSSTLLSSDSSESWTGRWFPESPTTATPSMGLFGKQILADSSIDRHPPLNSSTNSLLPYLGSFSSTSAGANEAQPEEKQISSQAKADQRLSNLHDPLHDTNRHIIISPQIRNGSLIPRPDESWTGRWFPEKMTTPRPHAAMEEVATLPNPNSMWQMINSSCDDGKTNLTVDWDGSPVNYTCFNPHNYFEPDYDLPNLIISYPIPKGYKAKHECMSWPIEYSTDLPTFGTHRPAWPRYGEYKFLPRQRWLHSLEHGAVVMLYHPCAHPALVNELRELVSSCLYRHVITPYTLLHPDRPFALLTWGWALLMTSPDKHGATNFIRQHALRGPEATSKDGQFSEGLIQPAKIITDQNDTTELGLCPQTMF